MSFDLVILISIRPITSMAYLFLSVHQQASEGHLSFPSHPLTQKPCLFKILWSCTFLDTFLSIPTEASALILWVSDLFSVFSHQGRTLSPSPSPSSSLYPSLTLSLPLSVCLSISLSNFICASKQALAAFSSFAWSLYLTLYSMGSRAVLSFSDVYFST